MVMRPKEKFTATKGSLRALRSMADRRGLSEAAKDALTEANRSVKEAEKITMKEWKILEKARIHEEEMMKAHAEATRMGLPDFVSSVDDESSVCASQQSIPAIEDGDAGDGYDSGGGSAGVKKTIQKSKETTVTTPKKSPQWMVSISPNIPMQHIPKIQSKLLFAAADAAAGQGTSSASSASPGADGGIEMTHIDEEHVVVESDNESQKTLTMGDAPGPEPEKKSE